MFAVRNNYRLALDALAEQADRDEPLPEALFATLDALAGSFTDKAVNVAAYLRALDAEAAAIADVKKAMERRQTALEHHQAERLRRYLKGEMERIGLTRVQHPWLTVRVQANPPSVVIDDEARLPDGFKQAVTTVKLLKADLAQALKAGHVVTGAHLEQTTRLVIA